MPVSRYPVISRLLAFLAVSCSIAAVSWAIRDFGLLAIGMSGLAAGHIYSWRRPEASIIRSLILLLFMVLTIFLGGDILLSGLSDRMLLSRYLVYGLVLGSFDLMRTRNIGASLVLGVLLLVLVSELALDLWFLLFLVLYIVLILAWAAVSRVDTEAGTSKVVGEIKWKAALKIWLGMSAATVVLTALIFLLVPRIAGSQVARANWLPSRLNLSMGGLLRLPSKPSTSVTEGILPSQAEGGAESSGYAELGYTGSYADDAVMLVRSQISSYWRGLTLDEYDGRGWLASQSQSQLRSDGRGEFSLPDSRVNLTGERVYWQAYYLLSDQPNAVFTGYNPGRIYLSQQEEDITLAKGMLYRSLSVLPFLRPSELRQDIVDPADTRNLKLPQITGRTADLAESVVAGAATDYDKAARLERFLLTNYPYRLDVKPVPEGRDAVDYFLFEEQAGYCAHFATAMAVMARQVGLPARVAAGYLPGIIDPLTGAHIVRVGDAHAWVEIHFKQHGWVAFDPTPRADAAMGFVTGRRWLRFGLDDFTGMSVAGTLAPLGHRFSLGQFSTYGWAWVVGLGGGVTVVIIALRYLRRRRKSVQKTAGYSTLEGDSRQIMLKFYRKMLKTLVRKGLPPRAPHQSPEEYAGLVFQRIPAAQDIVAQISRLAERAAYDPRLFALPDVTELNRNLSLLKRELSSKS